MRHVSDIKIFTGEGFYNRSELSKDTDDLVITHESFDILNEKLTQYLHKHGWAFPMELIWYNAGQMKMILDSTSYAIMGEKTRLNILINTRNSSTPRHTRSMGSSLESTIDQNDITHILESFNNRLTTLEKKS